MSGAYDPLRDSDVSQVAPASLDGELRLAREFLAEAATANIHDHHAMVRVAVGFDHRLRGLIAAIEAERGEVR